MVHSCRAVGQQATLQPAGRAHSKHQKENLQNGQRFPIPPSINRRRFHTQPDTAGGYPQKQGPMPGRRPQELSCRSRNGRRPGPQAVAFNLPVVQADTPVYLGQARKLHRFPAACACRSRSRFQSGSWAFKYRLTASKSTSAGARHKAQPGFNSVCLASSGNSAEAPSSSRRKLAVPMNTAPGAFCF